MAAQPDQDPTNLHDLAVDAVQDLQKLGTGLAHAGAAPQAVAQITQMIQILTQVVKVLGSGPPLPDAHQVNQAQQQQAGPPQPQGPPQGGPPQPPPPGAPPEQHSIHTATTALHAAMQQSAQRR